MGPLARVGMVALVLLVWSVLLCLPHGALAATGKALPPRDLTVELRQIDEAKAQSADALQSAAAVGKSYSAGTASGVEWEPQMVLVRNGEKASLRMQSSTPMQWVQSAFVQVDKAGAGNKGGDKGGNKGAHSNAKPSTAAGVQNALAWFDAGQSIGVHPQWSGGKSAVVELEVQSAGFEARTGADLPAQTRNAVSTTVTAPLAQWVTIAATGKAPQENTYSSQAAQQSRSLLQIRVMVP